MTVAFIHTAAEVVIILAILRLLEAWVVGQYGAENALAKALAFIH